MKNKQDTEAKECIDIFGETICLPKVIDESDWKRRRVGLFDFINDLKSCKINILRNDPESEKDLACFIINRALSMGIETIMYANEMNACPWLDKQLQYDFYIHAIRPSTSRPRWAKNEKDNYIDLICEYYSISIPKAQEALSILSEDDLENIKNKMDKGTTRSSFGGCNT